MITTRITRDQFPTSPLALRTADPTKQDRIRAFADHQADAATTARDRLEALWSTATGHADRTAALRTVLAELVDWRCSLADQATGRLGQGIRHTADRFRMPIGPGNTNYDRIGYVGRMRDGSAWDTATSTYTGGQPTPAYEAMLRYGLAAEDRFAAEGNRGDTLQNWVLLPDGTRIAGNRIVRGAAALAIAQELAARVAARGLDASRMETGGAPIYTATAAPDDSTALHAAALDLLADPALTADSYRTARYCLFQSPQMKKGSDAVLRTFVVAVGALALGDQAPALPADIDLRCYVLGQAAATQ